MRYRPNADASGRAAPGRCLRRSGQPAGPRPRSARWPECRPSPENHRPARPWTTLPGLEGLRAPARGIRTCRGPATGRPRSPAAREPAGGKRARVPAPPGASGERNQHQAEGRFHEDPERDEDAGREWHAASEHRPVAPEDARRQVRLGEQAPGIEPQRGAEEHEHAQRVRLDRVRTEGAEQTAKGAERQERHRDRADESERLDGRRPSERRQGGARSKGRPA